MLLLEWLPKRVLVLALGLLLSGGSLSGAAEENGSPLPWITDYTQAVEKAKSENRMLLILFQKKDFNSQPDPYEVRYLPDQAEALKPYVLAKLSTEATVKIDGKETRLLAHEAFREMHEHPGLAIIDYAHEGANIGGFVVSTFPLVRGKYYEFKPAHLPVALSLPVGTLSQRSLVYAVRVHPEHPASTQGQLEPILADEAGSHSNYQASIQVQGHHQWDSRFQRIWSKLLGRSPQNGPQPEAPQEVCAESWPNQDLMDSCVDCVASWRQSSGHWSAVSSPHSSYGYDIRQGRNSIWYATGIFANYFNRR